MIWFHQVSESDIIASARSGAVARNRFPMPTLEGTYTCAWAPAESPFDSRLGGLINEGGAPEAVILEVMHHNARTFFFKKRGT